MRHAEIRLVGQRRANLELIADHPVQPEELRAAAAQGDALVENVARQFRRRALDHPVQRAHQVAQRLIQRLDHLFGGHRHRARQTGNQTAPAGVHFQFHAAHPRRSDVDFQFFRRSRANEQVVLLAQIVDDRVVKPIPADVQNIPDNLMAEGKYGYVRPPAADVDVHASIRLVNAHACADRAGHPFIHRHNAPHARIDDHVHQRLPLAGRHAAGQSQQQFRAERCALADDLAQKIAQHLAHQVKTANASVSQRPFHNQPRRGAAIHAARLFADGDHIAGLPVVSHICRFAEHNALSPHHHMQGRCA